MPAKLPTLAPTGGTRAKIYEAALRLFAENGGSEITVSDLADAAGIARGTIYNNLSGTEDLLGDIAAALAAEMLARTEATMRGIDDPVERMATGMRLFIRRAHEEQSWGRFVVRFSFTHAALQGAMDTPPQRDIRLAVEAGRFRIEAEKMAALRSLQLGTTMAAMAAVIRGDQAWRDAGSDAAELYLRAAGIAAAEARRIARKELPPLAEAPRNTKRRAA
jgi:AcrR family transcriptional regulator